MSSSSLKVFVCQREIYRTYVLTYFNSVVATTRNLKIIFRSLIWRLLRELHTRIILINAPRYWKLKFLFAVTDQRGFSTKMLEGVCFPILQTCNIPDCEGVRRFKVWFIRTIAVFSYNDHSSNYSWIIWVLYWCAELLLYRCDFKLELYFVFRCSLLRTVELVQTPAPRILDQPFGQPHLQRQLRQQLRQQLLQ